MEITVYESSVQYICRDTHDTYISYHKIVFSLTNVNFLNWWQRHINVCDEDDILWCSGSPSFMSQMLVALSVTRSMTATTTMAKMMTVRMIIWVAFIFWIKSFFDSAPWVRFQSEARRSWLGFEKYKALLQEQKYQFCLHSMANSVFIKNIYVEYRSTTGRWFHSHSQKL